MLDEAVVMAGDLMTRDVAVVHPETSLLEAVKLMAGRRISGMPVVDDAGTIVGMLSEGDLVRWHEGYTERQARWLDMLAEGGHLAPAFLEGIREQQSQGEIRDVGRCDDGHRRYAGARRGAPDAQQEHQAGSGAARWQTGRHRRTIRPGTSACREIVRAAAGSDGTGDAERGAAPRAGKHRSLRRATHISWRSLQAGRR